eukprot:TRINITY_DN3388_c0_g1_i1.p1 TRINITY_DN3388_c0_g1~~TRINITY_DN3388_c0_g1_i1.p1  ORF type:complete len:77 (-),score=4.62 TRINITY_DN3388_c0_g1_i1:65-295(-)
MSIFLFWFVQFMNFTGDIHTIMNKMRKQGARDHEMQKIHSISWQSTTPTSTGSLFLLQTIGGVLCYGVGWRGVLLV